MSGATVALTPQETRACLGEDFITHFVDRVEERLGIDVIVVPLDGDGYSCRIADRDVVILGATEKWFRSHFTLAHELGHLLTGKLPDGDGDPQSEENGANAFAAELLMPAEQMRAWDWQEVGAETVARRVWQLGVSTAALRSRLRFLRRPLGEAAAQALAMSTPALVKASLSPDTVSQAEVTARITATAARRFPQRLLTDLREAVDAGKAPHASLAWALGVPQEDEDLAEPAPDLSADLLDGLV
nr:ImmA/IrrE family metallo-endopeptidase [Actinomyces sp.]